MPSPLYHSPFSQTFGEVALGRAGLVVVPFMVALSTFGASLSSVYTGSRLMFAAARDGLFPQALSGLHRTYKTPVPAIMLQVQILSKKITNSKLK